MSPDLPGDELSKETAHIQRVVSLQHRNLPPKTAVGIQPQDAFRWVEVSPDESDSYAVFSAEASSPLRYEPSFTSSDNGFIGVGVTAAEC
jgi:hypothetical protein